MKGKKKIHTAEIHDLFAWRITLSAFFGKINGP